MRPGFIVIVLICTLFLNPVKSQQMTVEGHIYISAAQGTMACEFLFSHLPKDKKHFVVLSSSFKPRYFKNPTTGYHYGFKTVNNDSATSENAGYYFTDFKGALFLPGALEMSYFGTIPDNVEKYTGGTSQTYSFKGNGACMPVPANWLPVIYSMRKKAANQNVVYNIHVHCNDCEGLYTDNEPGVKVQPLTSN